MVLSIRNFVFVSPHQRYRGAFESAILVSYRAVNDEGADPRLDVVKTGTLIFRHRLHIEDKHVHPIGNEEEGVDHVEDSLAPEVVNGNHQTEALAYDLSNNLLDVLLVHWTRGKGRSLATGSKEIYRSLSTGSEEISK